MNDTEPDDSSHSLEEEEEKEKGSQTFGPKGSQNENKWLTKRVNLHSLQKEWKSLNDSKWANFSLYNRLNLIFKERNLTLKKVKHP